MSFPDAYTEFMKREARFEAWEANEPVEDYFDIAWGSAVEREAQYANWGGQRFDDADHWEGVVDVKTTIRIAGTNPAALTDGPGKRFSIYVQGCSIHCPGCQVQHLWNPIGSDLVDLVDIESLAQQAADSGLPVSILGGEPFDQPDALYQLIFWLREFAGWDREIIIYSGYTIGQLLARVQSLRDESISIDLTLRLADVLVDGPFIADQDHDRLQYRGSANQRVIDLNATMRMAPKDYALRGPVLLDDWDTPELVITPDGDLLAAEGLAAEFAALGTDQAARRCGEVAR